MNLAVMIGPKGRGSNMKAIAEACASGRLNATLQTIISPGPNDATDWAETHGFPVRYVSPAEPDYAERLLAALKEFPIDYVCLAGYLRLLPQEVLETFPLRVLNIHPALLPKFGGKGMYGMKVHEAVLAAGEKESGCTIHFVSEQYDEGAILLQRRCPVMPDDTPETLAARVLGEEHLAYVEALQRLAG